MKYKLLVVIHESIYPYDDIAYTFQSSVYRGRYHALIKRDGNIIYIMKPNQKAQAAYESSFRGESIGGSVDAFSYHICLESPEQSVGVYANHIGYTNDQYYSLAWLISKLKDLDIDRIVGHKEVNHEAIDPRNLDFNRLKSQIKKFNHSSYIDTELNYE